MRYGVCLSTAMLLGAIESRTTGISVGNTYGWTLVRLLGEEALKFAAKQKNGPFHMKKPYWEKDTR